MDSCQQYNGVKSQYHALCGLLSAGRTHRPKTKIVAHLIKRYDPDQRCEPHQQVENLTWAVINAIQNSLSCKEKVLESQSGFENWGHGKKNKYEDRHKYFNKAGYDAFFKRWNRFVKTNGLANDRPVLRKRVVEPDAKIAVVGDIHSDILSLVRILNDLRRQNWFKGSTRHSFKLKTGRYLVFAGDMTDYGPFNLEIMMILMTLLEENYGDGHPQVLLCKGNHEESIFTSCSKCNFRTEVQEKVQISDGQELIKSLTATLPHAWFVRFGSDPWIQFNHGAIPRKEAVIDKVQRFMLSNASTLVLLNDDEGHDFLWGDFGSRQLNTRPIFDVVEVSQYQERVGQQLQIGGHQDREGLTTFPGKRSRGYKGCDSHQLPGAGQEYDVPLVNVRAVITSTAITKLRDNKSVQVVQGDVHPIIYLVVTRRG